MKVAFSLHPLVHHYQRGIHFYIKYLLESMAKINEGDIFFLLYQSIEKKEVNIEKEEFIFLPFKRSWEELPKGAKWLWEYISLPIEACRTSSQLLHIPDIGVPLASPMKLVTTVHSIMSYIFPYYLPALRERIKYRLKLLSLKRADRIIAISKSTKDDLINYLHIPPRKITVIPYGVEEKFKPIPKEKCKKWVEVKWGIKGDFILYVGALSPNKNIPRLLKAFSLLTGKGVKDYLLLIVASLNTPYYKEFLFETQKLGIDKKIRWLGTQSHQELVYLYNACTLFIFPSLYEGFGLPPLEAMACGAPVITSNTSSLPEVVGDAGILVDPKNPLEMQEAMRKILLSPSLREELSERAIKRAKEFSWLRTAKETLEVYRKVIRE